MSQTGEAAERGREVEPLGPGSLIWRYLGDMRYGLGGRAASTMQVMHPAIGAAVADEELSLFFKEPIARFARSMPLILGVVYDGPLAHATADELRDRHLAIKGTDHHGRRFHALDPDVFYWAHATFVHLLFQSIERFDHTMTGAERERLYDECRRWYRMYGLSERPMPEDFNAFQAYLDRMCEEELEATPTAVRGKAMFADPRTIPQNYLPSWLWRILSPLPLRLSVFMSTALMPPAVRAKMGYTWTAADERRFQRLASVIKRLWPLLPYRLRYAPQARAAFARTR